MDTNLIEQTEEFKNDVIYELLHKEMDSRFAESFKTYMDFLIQTIKQQQEQLERRKKALNFYADPKTYEVNVTDQWEPRTPIDEDAGNKARKALEES